MYRRRGALMTFGEHKGYAWLHLRDAGRRGDRRARCGPSGRMRDVTNGMLMIAIDPSGWSTAPGS